MTTYRPPLVVCCGIGQDSVGMLAGLRQRGIRPDAILFAETGSEKPGTYDYIPTLQAWLERIGFPPLTIVQYQPKDFKHWPPYHSLEENCLTNRTLPSIAYGFHSCSSKWKIDPQNKWLAQWEPAQQCWARGERVRKAIGFDASPHERGRAKGCSTYAVQDDEADKYELVFFLQEWGWDRARCVAEIQAAGLPVPPKSSCYFCTAIKPHEVDELPAGYLRRIVVIETRAAPRHFLKAMERGWPNGVGVPITAGLWRRAVKGMRGATPKPGSMTEYIRQKGLLSAEEIDRLQAETPTGEIHAGDITNWSDWLNELTADRELIAL